MIIGLMGLKKSGKTLAANYLVSNYNFVERAFADCLKKAIQEIFLLTDDQVFGTQEQKEECDSRWFNCSPRQILQFVGTDLLRNNLNLIMPEIGKNVFVHHMRIWCQDQFKDSKFRLVIPDVRFQNEVDFIHELGGIVIKINRFDSSLDTHASENELLNIENFDYQINNNTTIEEFVIAINECLKTISKNT